MAEMQLMTVETPTQSPLGNLNKIHDFDMMNLNKIHDFDMM